MGDQCHSFAFINKNASNISSREHIQKSTSHAQSVTWQHRHRGQAHVPKRKSGIKGAPFKKADFEVALHSTKDGNSDDLLFLAKSNNELNTTPAFSTNDPLCDMILIDQLDPFMTFPVNVTQHERNLLQFYLVVTPNKMYGTHSQSIYCPVRDRTAILIQVNIAWVECVILSAELDTIDALGAETSASILRRKASLYRSIREAIGNPATSHSDTTIARITLAAVVENRISHSSSEAQKHLAAVKRLLVNRGDRWTRVPITTMVVLIYLGTGVAAFPNVSTLEAAIAPFKEALLGFQNHQPKQLEESLQFHYNVYTFQGRPGVLLNVYRSCRRRNFSPVSPLRPFVEATIEDQDASQSRCHMAILWVLNRILWDLRFDYDKSVTFLDRLHDILEPMDLATTLKAMTVLFVIMDCVARMGVPTVEQTHNITDMLTSQGDDDRRILWWWEAVDAIELMLLMKEGTSRKILRLLSAELIGPETPGTNLPDLLLDDIADEIKLGWLYRA